MARRVNRKSEIVKQLSYAYINLLSVEIMYLSQSMFLHDLKQKIFPRTANATLFYDVTQRC